MVRNYDCTKFWLSTSTPLIAKKKQLSKDAKLFFYEPTEQMLKKGADKFTLSTPFISLFYIAINEISCMLIIETQ